MFTLYLSTLNTVFLIQTKKRKKRNQIKGNKDNKLQIKEKRIKFT